MTGSDQDDPRYGWRERAHAQRGATPATPPRTAAGRRTETSRAADYARTDYQRADFQRADGQRRDYLRGEYQPGDYDRNDHDRNDHDRSTSIRGDHARAGYGSPSSSTGDMTARRLARSNLWSDSDRGPGEPAGSQPLKARWDPVPPPRVPVARTRKRPERRRSAIGWFLHHYGWRAYALPVLAALTVVAVVNLPGSSGGEGETVASPPATGQDGSVITVTMSGSVVTTTISGPGVTTTVDAPVAPPPTTAETAQSTAVNLDAAKPGTQLPPTPAGVDSADAFKGVVMGVLPAGASFAQSGAGTFHVVPGTSEPFGDGPDHRTFTVEVEDGIESVSADDEFAASVLTILESSTSWIGTGKFTLQRIDSGKPDFRVTLTSQMTARQGDYCGWDVQLEASCYNYLPGRVVINQARWMRGAYSYNGDLASYRVYAINHEVGHALGYNHEPCPTNGGLAPVMMQQSWSTSDDDIAKLNPGGPVPADGKVCRANPFVTSP